MLGEGGKIMKEDKEKKDEEWKLEKLEDGNYGD